MGELVDKAATAAPDTTWPHPGQRSRWLAAPSGTFSKSKTRGRTSGAQADAGAFHTQPNLADRPLDYQPDATFRWCVLGGVRKQRERSFEAALVESSSRIEAWLAADQSSASQHAVREELLFRLARALAQLPDDQRAAVEMRHLEGLSVSAIGERLGRSKRAVVGLIFRGVRKLRALLDERDCGGSA